MQVHYFSHALGYLRALTVKEQSIINRQIGALRSGETAGVHTKQLKGPIRELIVGNHRITYFVMGSGIHFVRGFRKRSKKTPPAEIEYTEKVYREMSGAI